MSRPSPARIPSPFTLFTRLLAFRERVANLFRAVPSTAARSVKLGMEPMEDRLVPDGRPLPAPVIFAGSGAGETAVVKAYDADTGNLRWTKTVYGPSFTGGVRVGTADFTGDGIPDAVVAPGAGDVPLVRVLDGTTGNEISGPLGHFLAYSALNTSGVHVAAADVNGDGKADVITATDSLLGTRVRAFSGTTGQMLLNWNLTGTGFGSGVTVGAADLNGDKKAEIILGGSSGGWVKTYDPTTGSQISGPLGSFQAFGTSYTGSVFAGVDSLASDVDGDDVPDVVIGTGAGAAAEVKVFSGVTGSVLYDFQPFGASFTGGARVALAFVDDDDRADIVVGSGAGSSDVRVFSGATGAQLASPLGQYTPFPGSANGVFVAASNDPIFAPVYVQSQFGPAVVGQTVGFTVTVMKNSSYPTPTGTVTFYGSVGGKLLGTVPLVADASGNAVGGLVIPASLYAGAGSTLGVQAQYSGDGVYMGSSTSNYVTLNTGLLPGCVPCSTETSDGAGAGLQTSVKTAGGTSLNGVVEVSRASLTGQTGSAPDRVTDYTGSVGQSSGTNLNLTGAIAQDEVALYQNNPAGLTSIALFDSGSPKVFFDKYYDYNLLPTIPAATYHTRNNAPYALTLDAVNAQIVVTDGVGTTFRFWDFSAGNGNKAGRLQSKTSPDGSHYDVITWGADGRPVETQTTAGSGPTAVTESVLTSTAGGTRTNTLQRKVGAGSWTTVRSADTVDANGVGMGASFGQLQTVRNASGTALDTTYFRYETSGGASTGRVRYAFGPDAYARLTAALGTGVAALTDAQIAPYADQYYEYDSNGRATKAVLAGAGCSVCSAGQGEYTYAYTTRSGTPARVANVWTQKVVETQPDLSTNTYYSDVQGRLLFKIHTNGSGTQWMWAYRYDDAGRVILEAEPSAVSGFSESLDDLIGFSGSSATYLRDDDGLIHTNTYATTTTATTSTAGDVKDHLKQTALLHGDSPLRAAVPQSSVAYIVRTVGGQDLYFPASQTQYRNDDGTGGQATKWTYTWQGSTAQPASVTTELPTVATNQNGSGVATTSTVVYDALGRAIWSKDAAGVLSYMAYDDATGAVAKMIADVNTANTGDFTALPSGWSTPAGAGLHLISTFEVDNLGRTTKVTYPNGRIDYTVYNDTTDETRTYRGWNTTTNTPTGPTTVTREDRANGYTESLSMSAVPAVSGGRPTGAEAISAIQSLSRTYVNGAGQAVASDAYFNLNGLTYSPASSLGTVNVNYYHTTTDYGKQGGQANRQVSAAGTITRTEYDSLGRASSIWVGTDDAPTTGVWSTTNLTGTNMVKVKDYEYDGGGVSDGNLTKVTEYPGGGAAARVTQTWFDWRDRAVAVKSGVEASESTSVNRPLVYTDYDNLGEVTKTRVYDADTVTPTVSSGVPQPLSSSLLRAQSTTSYDELGRTYRTDTYSVDPSTGTPSTSTLSSQTWYDARGLVIKTLAPGGQLLKTAYDGTGRVTTTYVTDGGGDTGYSDADDVTGDIVLSQSETAYDGNGNVLQMTIRDRFHDASGTGALSTPTAGVAARVSYSGNYYDLADRKIAVVNVGTNGGSSWARPGTIPSRSATTLVTSTQYATDSVQVLALTGSPTGGTFTLSFGGSTTSALAYNASAATVQTALAGLASIGTGNVQVSAAAGGGWEVRFIGTKAGTYQSAITGNGSGLTGGTSPAVATSTINAGGDAGRAAEVTDPAGHVTRTYSDALGRTTRTVTNFVDGVVSDTDDKTTGYTYNGAGVTSVTAYLTSGGVQTTGYVYGVTVATGSTIESNDIVRLTQWADPTTGVASASQQEAVTVNALGQTLTSTDRNGSIHTLTYDVLGRVVSDAVTTLGSGVDGAVRRVETAYDSQGNAYLITSYNAASGGSVVNQVQRAYNGLGQLTTEWQSHAGAVNISTSPKIQYAYSEMAGGANHSRLTSIIYPSGYVLTYNYSSGLNDSISRLSSLSDSTGTLESYDYLGLDTVVRRAHPQPNVDLSYIKRTGESNGDAGDQYTGLDRFGRVVDQRWLNPTTGTATDRFQYGYDQASNRTYRDNLVNTAFGEVYSYDALDQLTGYSRGTLNGTKTGITGSATRSQGWDYDALGNFDSVTTNGTAQTRTANKQNEITSIGGATTPTYDANGNMTGDETGKQFVYDAWNRLVAVKNSGGTTLKTYSYDGASRRITETSSGVTTDLFYSDQWQVLEEKAGANTTNRYVWSPVYVDAMILRDRDTDGNGTLDERLWVQQDANWNVTALVNGSGTVVERYTYDPFGLKSVYSASWSSLGSSAYAMSYNFQGLHHDATSGLDAAHERWYSPTLGRWGSLDPIRFGGGDLNLYGFIGNNPTDRTDPSGLHYLSSFNPIIEIVDKAKATSDNGKAFFQVKWVIPREHQNSTGWIIQHVTKTFDVRDKDGKKIDVYHDYIGQIDPDDADFYEAWEFTPGGKVWVGPAKDKSPHKADTFGQGIDFGECTKGKIEIIAEVKVFPSYNLPASFKVKMDPLAIVPLPAAGALPVSKTMPPGWNQSLPGAKHTLTIEWDTTDPDPKKRKKTTVTSTPSSAP